MVLLSAALKLEKWKMKDFLKKKSLSSCTVKVQSLKFIFFVKDKKEKKSSLDPPSFDLSASKRLTFISNVQRSPLPADGGVV